MATRIDELIERLEKSPEEDRREAASLIRMFRRDAEVVLDCKRRLHRIVRSSLEIPHCDAEHRFRYLLAHLLPMILSGPRAPGVKRDSVEAT